MTPTAHSAEHRAEENRKAFLAFYDAFNRHDTGAMREIVAPDYVEHEQGPPGISTTGRQGVIDWAESMWAGMPDVAFHVHDVLSDGDRVAGRITVTGTHTEPLWGIPPTGRKVHFDALDIVRMEDGLAVEHWGVTDTSTLMSQIGLAPAEGVLETVQAIYEAFGAQDVPAILDLMAPDVVWEEGLLDFGVPWLRPGTGRDVVAAFFGAVAERLDITRFEVRTMLASGDQVAAVIDVEATDRVSGQDLSDPCEVHLWTVEDGKVTAFRHHVDTHRHVLASR